MNIFIKKYRLIVLTSLLFLFLFNLSRVWNKSSQNRIWTQLTLTPKCECRKPIEVSYSIKDLLTIYKVRDKYLIYSRRSTRNESDIQKAKPYYYLEPKFTCGLHESLSRGSNQKVLSYSLYGNQSYYSKYLDRIFTEAGKIYPDWSIRVYYNDSNINNSLICDIECKYKQLDFCNVKEIPLDNFMVNADLSQSYGMMWRWFPIADDFVDVFESRDLDSPLIQREKDSVDVWLEDRKLFHVMRDHPLHSVPILGGMLVNIYFI